MPTLLIVDDNPADVELLQDAFAECGLDQCSIRVARHGEEALALLAAAVPRPDAILLDLNMPRVDGRQVLAAIKRDPRFAATPPSS